MASIARTAAVTASAARSSGVIARGMATGSVKWFNMTKGFGFITPDDGSPDLFVHQSVVQANGFRYLKEGEKVKFDVKSTDKGNQAENVRDEAGRPFDRGTAGGEPRAPREHREYH